MSVVASVVVLLAAWGFGGPDGRWAAALGLASAVACGAAVPVASRKAGPVGAYALTVCLRVGVMLGGGAVLVLSRSVGGGNEFWWWLLAAYLAALVPETIVSARPRGLKG